LLLQASKDYNVGEAPDARAVEVAQELGLQLHEGAVARVFDCTSDIVLFDLLLVMDKVSQACFSLSLFILLLSFACTSLLLLSE
jgi:protein-tyrosine-phosphatase